MDFFDEEVKKQDKSLKKIQEKIKVNKPEEVKIQQPIAQPKSLAEKNLEVFRKNYPRELGKDG